MGQATTTFSFMLLPPEVRDLIYSFTFEDHPVHVMDTKLHRSAGSPNRPKHRHLPALVHVNRQLRKEALPAVAKQCTLIFNDYFNFAHLVNLVPAGFALHVRRISLKGDVMPSSLVTKFPSLRYVSYQQLGNCFYPPLRENGFNKQAMKAKQADLVDLIRGGSPALRLLEDVLSDFDKARGKPVQLMAEARVLSCHEKVQVWIDVNAKEVICRRLLGVHRLYDHVAEEKP
ncbi:hypothetical protein DV736_g1974, partial [Chaetothyriales sp. CBS 134916]